MPLKTKLTEVELLTLIVKTLPSMSSNISSKASFFISLFNCILLQLILLHQDSIFSISHTKLYNQIKTLPYRCFDSFSSVIWNSLLHLWVLQQRFFWSGPWCPCTGEIGFSRKNPYRDFFKIPLPEEIDFFWKFPIGKIISLCVGSVLWCVGSLKIFKVPLCVETLKIFKDSLCVGSVLWCVETLKIFKVPLRVGSVLWCVGSLKIFKVPLCVETLKIL